MLLITDMLLTVIKYIWNESCWCRWNL